MTELQVVLLALAAFLGALVPLRAPVWLPVALVLLAFAARWPLLLVAATALLTATLAHRSWAGLAGDQSGQVDGRATVVTDPERRGAGTTAVVRIDGMRVIATGYGGPGARLARSSAGEILQVSGTLSPYRGSAERKAALHAAHRLALDTVDPGGSANVLWRAANAIRDLISGGASSLSDERRALFTGIVYGDDRAQSPLTEVDFRLAGLTHLLAVSGQNVAYTLTVMRPLVERASLRGRWAITLGVLLVFATVTRYEPSVLRATMMAGLAVTARLVGREATAGRLLALAVTALLVIDPLLAETIAFRLSVAASAGIVWLQPRIEPALRGPRWLRETLGVTLSAQLAVAPILVGTFGPVSVASVPANVVAGPIAGVLMGWGLTGGVAAGLLPDTAAATLHLGTRALLALLEQVARTAAGVPLSPVGLGWIGIAAALAVTASWWRPTRPGRAAAALVAVALALALAPSTPHGRHRVGFDSELTVGPHTTVLELGDERRPVELIEDLRRLDVTHIDRVIASSARHPAVTPLTARISVAAVVTEEPDP